MSILNILLVYSGAIALALLLIYSFRDYWITLIAGFIAFCVFYFSFGTKNFEWEVSLILRLLIDAAIIYFISFVIAIIIYRLFPLKQKQEPVQQ